MPLPITRRTKKERNNVAMFAVLMTAGIVALIVLTAVFVSFGAQKVSVASIWRAIFAFDGNDFEQVIIRNIRLPRLIADIIVGVSLAVSGAVMQGNTKNPMADTGIMGISSGSVFAVVIMLAFLPSATRLERIGYSCLGAGAATLLIYGIAMIGRRGATAERMVLSGMAISTLFVSVTSAIVLKYGMSGELMKYTAGSSANTIWLDIEVSAPFFIAGLAAVLIISRSLTVMNLGDDVSRGLGANVFVIKLVSTVVVLVLSAIAVIIIGPVGFVGLMIPHMVRHFVGTDYRLVLPSCAVFGAVFVVLVDLFARIIIAPLEFPVGVLVTELSGWKEYAHGGSCVRHSETCKRARYSR